MVSGTEQRLAVAEDHLIRTLEQVGFPHTTARVYVAMLLAEGEGMSTGELIEKLDVSKASISQATQFLVGVGFAERYRVPGSREAHYRFLKGIWGQVLAKKFMAIGAVRRTIDEALDLGPSPAAKERLEEMAEVYTFFDDEFAHVMKRWDERTSR